MITIIGLGFVGLTTGLGFAKKGFKTFGIDHDKERIDKLNDFIIPFHEPHLKEVLIETYQKTFFIQKSLKEAIYSSKYVFFCVGTPGRGDGEADLSYLFKAIDQVLSEESKEELIMVIKSTIPPSTLSLKIKPYIENKAKEFNRRFKLVSNPEFLREGYCWEDFYMPDRIVIGIENDTVRLDMDKIYSVFGAPIHYVSFNTSEFIKYLSNTMLSTMISYSNEMSMIADTIGQIDISASFRILHQDKRWFGNPALMSSYVYPGCGYGGYCLPKDTAALTNLAATYGIDAAILKSNIAVNERIKRFLVNKIKKDISTDTGIGILGLSFKPESDDVRLSPSKDFIEILINEGYNNLIAYDPLANNVFKNEYPDLNILYANSLDELLGKVKAVVILTAWNEFKQNKELIEKKIVFDFRYVFESTPRSHLATNMHKSYSQTDDAR